MFCTLFNKAIDRNWRLGRKGLPGKRTNFPGERDSSIYQEVERVERSFPSVHLSPAFYPTTSFERLATSPVQPPRRRGRKLVARRQSGFPFVYFESSTDEIPDCTEVDA